MSDTPKAPEKWDVRNGAFIGFTLVSREDKEAGGGMKRMKDDWMPWAVDLRVINAIKQYGFDQEDSGYTALYHSGRFVGCVNVSYDELLPCWLATRDLFDEKR